MLLFADDHAIAKSGRSAARRIWPLHNLLTSVCRDRFPGPVALVPLSGLLGEQFAASGQEKMERKVAGIGTKIISACLVAGAVRRLVQKIKQCASCLIPG